MRTSSKANIAAKPNVWCDPKEVERSDPHPPYFLETIIPGDLLVAILGTRDVRVIRDKLTREQLYEYEQSRFFQPHGQKGLAFED